jgi:hypothetical protein
MSLSKSASNAVQKGFSPLVYMVKHEAFENFHLYPVIIHIGSDLLEAVQKPFWQGALVPSMGNPILEGGV